jgi:putative flavoprotein involved in K+ transport
MEPSARTNREARVFTQEASPAAREHVPPSRFVSHSPRPFDVVVIGAGQAGLSVGYQLRGRGLRMATFDANARIGDSWRKRWESLRLFTPASLDGLEGMPFPGPPHSFPTKNEMGDYLEAYAAKMDLPVQTGVQVTRLWRRGDLYVLATTRGEVVARQVVVAMASYQRARVPPFAAGLRSDIVQLHSSQYTNPAQLADGPVLIVGAGNSGAEIARELSAAGRTVWLAGRDTGAVPFRIEGLLARWLLVWLVLRVVFHRILTVRTPLGRRVRPSVLTRGGALIRVKGRDLLRAGVRRVRRVEGTRDGLPVLADGRTLDVNNVVWCTGFDPGFTWIELPIFDDRGEPRHHEGIVQSAPGLYFVGLHFLFAMSSTMIHGVGRDARRIARALLEHRAAAGARAKDVSGAAA